MILFLFFIAKYFDVFKIVNNLIIDMKNRNLEIIKTLDGSNFCDDEDRIYHSRYGELFKNQLIFL